MAELKNIKGVQIFSAGTWNGDQYTIEDLDEMVKAFNGTNSTVRPFLKLGHDNEQKLLQSEGLPAAGWVERIYRAGEKLYADFCDIPDKIYDLIQRKAYRKVSCEIYLDVKLEEKSYKYLIGAIALLGAETPGVMNLNDILSLYTLVPHAGSIKVYKDTFANNQLKIYSLDSSEEGTSMPKTEQEIKLELEVQDTKAKLEKLEAEAKKFKADFEAEAKAKEKLENEKKEAETKLVSLEQKLFDQELEGKLNELQNEKLMTPSMRPYAKELLGVEKKEYAFKDGDKETKLTKFEVIKKLFELVNKTSEVNTEEKTEETKPESKKDSATEAKIQKYMLEHKVKYTEAYKAVLKDQ